MQAVILAAGLGSRLGNLKGDKPKAFLQPKGLTQSLIERSIGILVSFGIVDIVIGTGYKSEYFENLKISGAHLSTCKNPLFDSSGSSQTLQTLKDKIHEDFLLLESDLLYEKRAIQELLDDCRRDLILGSGRSDSGDEVYLEINQNQCLNALSKDKTKLKSIDAELVGISKISYESFLHFDFHSKDYEELLIGFEVLKIEDLVWCEIDCKEHLERAEKSIIPKLLQ